MSMMENTYFTKRLTIFTPTYNRAYILPKLYESLCVQTCRDFEWLIVDDGSLDGTHDMVDEWIQERKIDIHFIYQVNGGKMRAYNRGVAETKTELFVCIDSDDQLASEKVVEDSLAFWDEHKNDAYHKPIAGMVSVRRSLHGKHDLSAAPAMGTLHELNSYYGGETTIIILTDILRHYPYPSFEGEKFVTDVYIYDQMDEDYLFLFHPYISQNCEYHEDGYTMSYRKLLLTNPRGHREYHLQCLRLGKGNSIKSIICYMSLSLFARDHTMFTQSPNLPLTILLYPVGCLKYLYDRFMLWKEK